MGPAADLLDQFGKRAACTAQAAEHFDLRQSLRIQRLQEGLIRIGSGWRLRFLVI